MNGLKVSGSDSKVRPGRTYIKNPPLQQEKESLDDLTMELELADEDQPVLYVRTPLRKNSCMSSDYFY